MSYEIIVEKFVDLKDRGRVYFEGEKYPSEYAEPSNERVQSLLSGENKSGKQIIKEVEDDKQDEVILEDLEAKELKEIADERGIEYAKNASKETMLELLTKEDDKEDETEE